MHPSPKRAWWSKTIKLVHGNYDGFRHLWLQNSHSFHFTQHIATWTTLENVHPQPLKFTWKPSRFSAQSRLDKWLCWCSLNLLVLLDEGPLAICMLGVWNFKKFMSFHMYDLGVHYTKLLQLCVRAQKGYQFEL